MTAARVQLPDRPRTPYRLGKLCAVAGLLVSALSASVLESQASGSVQWRVEPFASACQPKQRIALSVDGDALGAGLGRVIRVGPDRLAMATWHSNRVQVFDNGWKPLFAFGRTGGGPGEMRSASDVAMLSDSSFAVSDPMQMRMHLFSSSGTFLRSFATSRFPAHRIVGLPGNRIAAAGLSNIAATLQFLAIYTSDGRREMAAIDVPEPFASISPRNDDAVIAVRADSSILLVPAALDTIFQWRHGRTTKVGLALPQEYWKQVQQSDFGGAPLDPSKVKAASFAHIFGGGLMNDSTLGLGWRTGTAEKLVVGVISLSRMSGTLLTESPGWLMGVDGNAVWMLTEQLPDSNIVQSFTCRPAQ